MMRMIMLAGVVVVALHGLIHLMGFVAYWPLGTIAELPYKTHVLDGRWHLGEDGMRLFGLLWLVATIGFVVGAGGWLAGTPWALPLLAATAALSLVICLLDWPVAFRGAIVDVVILVVLALAAWGVSFDVLPE